MKRPFSRRTLLAGVGGAAVSAAAAWELVGPGFRLRPPGEEERFVEEHGNLTEHDGWLVTVPDKRLLEYPVRYLEGWYREEGNSEATWRWSRKAASILAPNLGVEATMHLDYDSRADLFRDRPRTITVSLGDQVLESFVAEAVGRQRRGIALPAGTSEHSEVLELTLAANRTFVPAEHMAGSQDRRELGLQVYGVEIREGGFSRWR